MAKKVRFKSNAVALMKAVISRGLTIQEAAKMAGVNANRFGAIAYENTPISVKTAGKLAAAFGDGVIILCTTYTPSNDENTRIEYR